MSKIRVTAIQMDVALGVRDANIKHALNMIERGRGSHIFVLPELFTTGFCPPHLGRLAEPIPGPTTDLFAQVSQRTNSYILGSILERMGNDKPLNTAFVTSPQGRLAARYSKIHLFTPSGEHTSLTPGRDLSLFETEYGRFGVIICYDLRFPELSRALALKGAEAIFVPAGWPTPRQRPWRILLQSRAIENQLFVIGANRVGSDGNEQYFGGSLIIDPLGNILAEGGDSEDEVSAELDLSSIQSVREKIPCLQDRRPDLYPQL